MRRWTGDGWCKASPRHARLRLGVRQQGKAEVELRPQPASGASSLDAAAVGLDQRPDERQTEPQTSPDPTGVAGTLEEGTEKPVEHGRLDALAGVVDADDDALVRGVGRDAHGHAAPGFRELGGIREKVPERLRETHPVALHVERGPRLGQHQLQLDSRLREEPEVILEHAAHQRKELEVFPVERDLAARDASRVEQLVDEGRELRELAVHDLEALLGVAGRRSAPEDLQAGADRSERVPELVAQQGEELVLLLGLPAQRLVHPLQLRDVAEDRGRADQPPLRIP